MKIQFLGAADGVTGSRHLVQMGEQRVLLDCGLYQGFKVHRERNWLPPGPELLSADAVVLSHAHLDHSGWLPVLVKHGWAGPIYATRATCDLAAVLLQDSAHLQEEDARRANRYGYSRHAKALPLYTRKDADRAIARLRPLKPGQVQAVGAVQVQLSPVGHLLGACSVSLTSGAGAGAEQLAFSGDVGRPTDLLMPPPEPLQRADVLIVESTYGDRRHAQEDTAERLAEAIRRTVQRGGSVLLPAFAVGRAQALMLVLQRLRDQGQIPTDLPVFLDSPMAIEATALYHQHAKLLRIPAREAAALTRGVRMVSTPQESARLARSRYPSVIISASGMATGGRVLNHLKAMLPEPRHHVIFAGFQVGGSRGARLIAGEREVKIHGEQVPVRADVSHLDGFSGHADADELLAWLRPLKQAPRAVFVVHGEPAASDALRRRLKDELGWPARVPQWGESVSL